MLEKQVVLGLISILESRQMQIREDTVVYEDGVELSRTYMRYTAEPDQPVDDKPQIVQDLANLLWTPEVIARFKEQRDKSRPPDSGPIIPDDRGAIRREGNDGAVLPKASR